MACDKAESLNHAQVGRILQHEISDASLKCLIFGEFKAFHDLEVIHLLDLLLCLEVPKDKTQQRRLERSTRWIAKPFSQSIWAKHIRYEEDASVGSATGCTVFLVKAVSVGTRCSESSKWSEARICWHKGPKRNGTNMMLDVQMSIGVFAFRALLPADSTIMHTCRLTMKPPMGINLRPTAGASVGRTC